MGMGGEGTQNRAQVKKKKKGEQQQKANSNQSFKRLYP